MLVVTAGLMICAIGGVRIFFEKVVKQDYRGDLAFTAMDLSRKYVRCVPIKQSMSRLLMPTPGSLG